jgi:aryl-alcohol dehydrogenase-like predicted oxidoreductase
VEKDIKMNRRKLGRQGLEVSAIGLGCMGMSQWYGKPDHQESENTLRMAIDMGITFFDTAEGYGPYENEALLGKVLSSARENVCIATKFGFLAGNGEMSLDNKPTSIRKSVDGSLSRLKTDYIDVLYQHRFDPKIPIEEVVGTMGQLVDAGKVRYLGLCEVGVDTIRRAHNTFPISVVQSEYSIWEKNLEDEVIPEMRKLGIGLVAFCPLGRGFLTGTTSSAESYEKDDFRSHDPRFYEGNYRANMNIVKKIKSVASEIGITSAQLAIAWILHQGNDVVPIPGTKHRKYLQENVLANNVILTEDILNKIRTFIPDSGVSGPRYNDRMMSLVDR